MSDLYEELIRGYRESLERQDYKMAAVITMSIVNMAMRPGSGHNPVTLIQKMITPPRERPSLNIKRPIEQHHIG